jgi:hypothetical protein
MISALFWVITQRIVIILYRRYGPVGCPETSVRNYHYSLRNGPEESSYNNLNMSVAGIPRQETETGAQNFGSALKMIMGLTVPDIIKICPRDWGVAPVQKIPYALFLPDYRRNTTRWQHWHTRTNDWFASKAPQSRAEVK